tara:strand:- start:97 stop:636 length:540 start_codon:yes stop_codon:yes gene_type:complete
MFKIMRTAIKGLVVIERKKHKDHRGYLMEMFQEKIIGKKFKFQILSKSKKNVLRGLHFQLKKPQAKYISVIKGKILDVVVDLRKNSKTFGKVYKIILSEKNCKSIFIPAGFAHGFLTLEKENIIHYSCTEYRSIGNEFSLLYNDPELKIKWPKTKFIITKKDLEAKKLKELFKEKIIKE